MRVPSPAMADPDPVSNGRTSFGKVGWNNTPGDRLAITVTLPAINGNSRTFRLSITCPIEPVDVSSSRCHQQGFAAVDNSEPLVGDPALQIGTATPNARISFNGAPVFAHEDWQAHRQR